MEYIVVDISSFCIVRFIKVLSLFIKPYRFRWFYLIMNSKMEPNILNKIQSHLHLSLAIMRFQ